MVKVLSAFFSLLGISLIFGCRSRERYATALDRKSLLWEVSGRGLATPSYIFGTMHLMCAEDVQISGTLGSVIKNINEVYLEVDLDNASELLSGVLGLRNDTGKNLRSV